MTRRSFTTPLIALISLPAFATAVAATPNVRPAPQPIIVQQQEEEEDEGPGDYQDALPDNAETREGLFRTHFGADGSLFFEIPESELNKEMLVMVGTLGGSGDAGDDGSGDIIEFQRRGDVILLRLKDYAQLADSTDAIWRAVRDMRQGPILATFDIEAFAPDGSALIDATELFTSTHEELGSLSSVDDDASWIEHVAAFPTNIEVDITQTGSDDDDSITQRQHWSFLRLPDEPMMPRYADDRVGYISHDWVDYSSDYHGTEEREIIHRHRLEKQNSSADMSDPVEPIVYWVDPATPDWLKPYVVQGVNDWQPAFEAAGFSNAIMGRLAPTPEDDPDFSMDDARYSVIYWRPSTTANANGGQVEDPRSGEIIRGRVQMYHNVQNLVRNWYFTQVGPLDERAQSLPMPPELMGRLVQYVVAHEIGHAIGFPHNMKASGMYPVDSIRSQDFLERMGGHVATLMDYSRFNYVAQPEDNIPPELLIPGVGPYDEFAVKWGYAPIPGAQTPEDERETLDMWARQQDTIPWFRFTTSGSPNDPHDLTEAVGDQDAVTASGLGLRNLERVKDMLLDVAEQPGQSYELLDDLYGNVVSQWGRYNGHVAAIVGGAYTQEKYGTGPRFDPIERDRQSEAVQFLNDNVFNVPEWILDTDILRRIEAEGAIDRISDEQADVLGDLLDEDRLNQIIEYEALAENPDDMYNLFMLMSDLRAGIWTEFQPETGQLDVNVYRRNLQRQYVHQLDERLNPPTGPDGETPDPVLTDVRPVLRGELRWLQQRLGNALPRASNDMTRLHIQDLQQEVNRVLAGLPAQASTS